MNETDIDQFMAIMKKIYTSWAAPAITIAAQKGATPFQILVATLISLRTRDSVTGKAAENLFKEAVTPEKIIKLGHQCIARLIHPASFSPTKAKRMVAISHILLDQYSGKVPDNMEGLLALPGVGRKTANLVLVEAFGKDGICVDTHVHRISNRTGYISSNTPEQTEMALRKKLPSKYWKSYPEILVVFGQKICKPQSPRCLNCPISLFCQTCQKTVPK